MPFPLSARVTPRALTGLIYITLKYIHYLKALLDKVLN